MTNTNNQLSTTETAKLVRQALKATYPAQKFTVKSSRGLTINVRWTDGPAQADVKALVDGFDVTYMFAERRISAPVMAIITVKIAELFAFEQGDYCAINKRKCDFERLIPADKITTAYFDYAKQGMSY